MLHHGPGSPTCMVALNVELCPPCGSDRFDTMSRHPHHPNIPTTAQRQLSASRGTYFDRWDANTTAHYARAREIRGKRNK